MKTNMTTSFPLDLKIEEIGVTIDERSDAYTVGDKAAAPRVLNPYARVLDSTTPTIRALGRRDNLRQPRSKSTYKYNDKPDGRPSTRNTQTCKACMGIGHCITNPDTICYIVAKAHLSNRYMDDTANT